MTGDSRTFRWKVEIAAARETREHALGEILQRAFFPRADDAFTFAMLRSGMDTTCRMTLLRTEPGRLLSADFSGGALPTHLLDAWGRPALAIPEDILAAVRAPMPLAA